MNEFDDIDRELAAAFTQRPSTLSRPSLRDVKRRARRHQRQRSAGVLGACAVVGVGGVAVIAQRSPSNETAVGGLEGDGTTFERCYIDTTIAVYEADTMPYTLPTSTWPAPATMPINILSYHVVEAGDTPAALAAAFGVTLEALNAANHFTEGYDAFSVGLAVAIPYPNGLTPTTPPPSTYDDGMRVHLMYTLVEGDFPGSVAQMFGVTVAGLDAANRDVPGYGGFIVGTVINIPEPSSVPETTTFDPSSATSTTAEYRRIDVDEISCGPDSEPWVGNWRCTGGPIAVEGDYSYFDICEPVSNRNTEPTVSTIVYVPTTFPPNFTRGGTAIQVVNTSNQEGAAGFLANALIAEGFAMVESDTGTIDLPVTKVLYNPDDPNALDVALAVAVTLGNVPVEPSGPLLPTLTLSTWPPGCSVIVLLGDDLAGKTLAQIHAQINPSPTVSPTSTTA